jgi:diguanylate cyclase (GGDEF)-like protein/PAS domain S-box-containing protein
MEASSLWSALQLEVIARALEMAVCVIPWLIFLTGYRPLPSERSGSVRLLAINFSMVGVLEFLHWVAGPGLFAGTVGQASAIVDLVRGAAALLAATALLVYVSGFADLVSEQWHKRWTLGFGLVSAWLWLDLGVRLMHPASGPAAYDPLAPVLHAVLAWGVVAASTMTLAAVWLYRYRLLGEGRAVLCVSALFLGADGYLGLWQSTQAVLLGNVCRALAYGFVLFVLRSAAVHRPMAQLLRQAARERVAFTTGPDGVLLIDEGGAILLANPAMEELVGQRAGDLVGRSVGDVFPHAGHAKYGNLFRQHFLASSAWPEESVRDVQLVRPDGSSIPVDISVAPWRDGARASAVVFIRDISAYKQQVERLRHQATHDELTGLPNRWLFRQHLEQALARSTRDGHRVAVMYLDLDDFKWINDTLGHASGDALLIQVARRLRSSVRESDTLARLGGDEFAILLPDIVSAKDIMGVANKLLSAFDGYYQLGAHEVKSAGSLGIAVYPDDASDAATLLDCADAAMYDAKRLGCGGYARYSRRPDHGMRQGVPDPV